MPGIVLFNRRWALGSDDFVVPGVFNLILHIVWLIILSIILGTVDFGRMSPCVVDLHEHVLGYVVILTGCIVVEACISWVSMRGSILNTEPRASMQYLLYVRLGILLVEIAWLVVGGVWIGNHYKTCPTGVAKEAILGIVVCNWVVMMFVLIAIWCTFDAAGRSWVKMKKYQRNLRDSSTRFYRRSGSSQRNWRHRKAMQEYRDSWNKRCRLLFCCMNKTDQERNSFGEIAKLLSEFFRDLDVVPSDVVAGLVLLRKYQKLQRETIVEQKTGIFQFLSGVAVTQNSRFLDINNENVVRDFKLVIHHMRYAVAAYGWPMYMIMNPMSALCTVCCHSRCCCLPSRKSGRSDSQSIVNDNCCHCNYTALKRICKNYDMDLVFGTYHVEIGETPFFVAVDHEKRNVVVSIRGTLSLQDVVTDLNAEAEPIPTDPMQDSWYGHKGMVQAAEYIRRKLINDQLLARAFNYSIERGTLDYQLVLVGHSLGAGTAAILAILLINDFPNLHCYSFSPPGGLLSQPLAEYTKAFVTSVVVGKDLVPRIGLHQMEHLRSDLINCIKKSCDPKWKVIASGVMCCCSDASLASSGCDVSDAEGECGSARDASTHPCDSSIALTVHQPLYPPGRIIHIVRNHPPHKSGIFRKSEPIYQALWAETTDFDQVLISPVMIQDHMPDKVLEALEKVLINTGPPKPHRRNGQNVLLTPPDDDYTINSPGSSPSGKLLVETSFTNWNPANNRLSQGNRDSLIASFAESDRLVLAPPSFHKNSMFVPLASPETMSDVSSLSSYRSSARSSCCETSDTSSAIDGKSIEINSSSSEMPDDGASKFENYTTNKTEITVEIEPKAESISPTESSTTISCDQDSNSESKPNSILKITKSEPKRVTFDLASASVHPIPNDRNVFMPNYPTYSTQSEYGKHIYEYNGSHDFNQSPPPKLEKECLDGKIPSNNNEQPGEVSSADFLKIEMPPVLITPNGSGTSECDEDTGSQQKNGVATLDCIDIKPPDSFS